MPYQTFTVVRAEPDIASLVAALKALDATAGLQHDAGTAVYRLKKNTTWTAPQIAAAQSAIEGAPAASARLSAQAALDAMGIYDKAIVLTILDQFNTVRAKLSPPLPAITVQQMLDAIRTKAGTL